MEEQRYIPQNGETVWAYPIGRSGKPVQVRAIVEQVNMEAIPEPTVIVELFPELVKLPVAFLYTVKLAGGVEPIR